MKCFRSYIYGLRDTWHVQAHASNANYVGKVQKAAGCLSVRYVVWVKYLHAPLPRVQFSPSLATTTASEWRV